MDQKKTSMKMTVAALMMGLLLSSLDQTIVSTAMPTIIGVFGELDKFVWVISAYAIASVVGMPIFGKLSDMYGRKRFFLLGLVVFMAGSALCGTAESMTQLIIYRAIQGIGGGALMPIVFTIVFDIFPPEQRGKVQGLFGSVFGVSSVLGPLAGAFFTDYVNWRWCFYVNLPLGILSFLFLLAGYHETRVQTKQKIDYFGTVLMVISIMCLMFGLELGGKEFAWNSWVSYSLFGGFAVLLVVFLWWETKASEPIVNLKLFHNRLFSASMGVSFLYGSMMIAGATYIPLFIQGVFNGSATNAGLVLTPMMLGVVASSMLGGRLMMKTSYRNVLLFSIALVLLSLVLLSMISIESKQWVITCYMVAMGLGIGASFPIISSSALHNTDYKMRGSANSMNTFFRMIGTTIGITVFGMLQSNHLGSRITDLVPPEFAAQIGDGRGLLQEKVKAGLPADVYHNLLSALADSIANVFTWAILAGVLAVFFILMMGNSRLEVRRQAAPEAKPAAVKP